MNEQQSMLCQQTRRHFFKDCGLGIGKIALASLLTDKALTAAQPPPTNPLAPRPPHFKPRAKSVIFLFMAGGPSQLELFDYKPELNRLDGQPIPEAFVRDR